MNTDTNILIAEFMGCKQISTGVDPRFEFDTFKAMSIHQYGMDTWLEATDTFNQSELRFGTAWDWLMPVVEKITSIPMWDNVNECNYIYFGFDYEDNSHYVNLYHGEDNQINGNSKTSKLQAVHEAVIKFIEWYNENK